MNGTENGKVSNYHGSNNNFNYQSDSQDQISVKTYIIHGLIPTQTHNIYHSRVLVWFSLDFCFFHYQMWKCTPAASCIFTGLKSKPGTSLWC